MQVGHHAEAAAAASDQDTLVGLFELSVQAHPDAPAVSDEELTLSYADLAARSDELAGMLRERGVRRGARVAVYLDRGVDVFVALLGVLKAGAAYVAVDPRYPDERRDLMIRLSGASLAITAPGWARLRGVGADLLEWRTADRVGSPAREPAPARDLAPSGPRPLGVDTACVLFTSGSSGTPKAIALQHQNLAYLATNRALPGLAPGDRFGQVSSLSFDAFHIETWCTLAQGAEVAVLPSIADLVTLDMQRELRRRRITAMLVPTMAVNHLAHEDRDAFAALRVFYTGGDVVQPAAVRTLLAGRFKGALFNLYGPSEAATACTAHRVGQVTDSCAAIPIGRAMDGATIRLLDEGLAEVEPHAVGQLHIGGRGVGLGYLGAPALTAEHFIPDPCGEPGARMYATGDLASADETGVITFCGRADDQVKIRGYRVEPGEAERALVLHPGVRDVAAFVGGRDHDRRLIALVVAEEPVTSRALRGYLADRLPDYLVPSLIAVVPKIPANDHGKRDLPRLRAMAEAYLDRESDRVEPADEIERYLFRMWEELLGVEWIASTDDFFALGGHSMLAFRAQLRIERDLAVQVSVGEIFEGGDLSAITNLVRERRSAVPVA